MKFADCPNCGFHDDGFTCYGLDAYWDEEKGEYICPHCGSVLETERY